MVAQRRKINNIFTDKNLSFCKLINTSKPADRCESFEETSPYKSSIDIAPDRLIVSNQPLSKAVIKGRISRINLHNKSSEVLEVSKVDLKVKKQATPSREKFFQRNDKVCTASSAYLNSKEDITEYITNRLSNSKSSTVESFYT